MNESIPFSLEDADLSSLFLPAWAKEGNQKHSFRSTPEKEEKKERRHPAEKFKSPKRFLQKSSFLKQHEPSVSGWKIQLIPESRGIDEMAKQIRKEMKAYSLFDLTRILLEKPQRYYVKWSQPFDEKMVYPFNGLRNRKVRPSSEPPRSSEEGQLLREKLASEVNGYKMVLLFQCLLDETLWLSEKEALAHAFSKYRDRYYRSERVTQEPPKGSYSSVGICGMSQTLLGPPNHHEYQNKIRRLHEECFSHLPLEVFKSRIQMTHDQALLERWKEEQSSQEIFYLLDLGPEGVEKKIGSLAEAEEHFSKNEVSSVVKKIEEKTILSNFIAWQNSSPAVQRAVQQEVESLKRFPFSLSQEVGQALAARGLQLFKAHKNIVYVSIARPRSFHKEERAISDSLKKLLEILKTHATLPRAEQWKALLASDSSEQISAEYKATLMKDLSWLLHEGYVVNYATKGFEVS